MLSQLGKASKGAPLLWQGPGQGVKEERPFDGCGEEKNNKGNGSIKRDSVQRAVQSRQCRTLLRAKSMHKEHSGSRERHVQQQKCNEGNKPARKKVSEALTSR